MRKMLEDRGITDCVVTSSGTSTTPGYQPMPESVEVAKQAGIDISKYESTITNAEIIIDADLILTMEDSHRQAVIAMVPEAFEKTKVITEYRSHILSTGDVLKGIADPLGAPIFSFRECFMEIHSCLEEVMNIHFK